MITPPRIAVVDDLLCHTNHQQTRQKLIRIKNSLLLLLTDKSKILNPFGFLLSDKEFTKLFGDFHKNRKFVLDNFLELEKRGWIGFNGNTKLGQVSRYKIKDTFFTELVEQVPVDKRLSYFNLFNKNNTKLKNSVTEVITSHKQVVSKLAFEINEVKNNEIKSVEKYYSEIIPINKYTILYKEQSRETINIINELEIHREIFFITKNMKQIRVEPMYTEDKEGRVHHVLQHIPKKHRPQFFSGWYNYDIDSSAPTILSQMYKRISGEELQHVITYINNKNELRQYWADLIDVDVKVIKNIINSMFFGGSVPSANQLKLKTVNWSIKTHLSTNQILKLLSDTKFSVLRSEINMSMRVISGYFKTKNKEVTNSVGKTQKFERWNFRKVCYHLYIGVERRILNLICEQLPLDTQYVKMHDGIIIDTRLSTSSLSEVIYDSTGYKITYTETQIY